ncbi:MAG: DNA recombination protein RmuC [Pseudomonadota bacterium]|nr:MAG: DNA recombination protein RmuC [Pseudomonadota bacterium]
MTPDSLAINLTDSVTFALAAAFAIGSVLGALVAYLHSQRKIAALREQYVQLATTLEHERRAMEEKLRVLDEARTQLADTFSALSSQALKHNSEEFLRLARENMQHFHTRAEGDLAQREKAIEHLVKPIREALDKTESQIREIEKDRQHAYGSLNKHLEQMAQTQAALQSETRNLVQALRRPEVRGQWGELTLKRLAELAGMVEHCDFYEQEQVRTEEGAARPDMIVRMPGGREVVVDAKTPLDAYLSAMESPDDDSRQKHLAAHSRHVRERIRELASKGYWSQFKNAPDFVVLFIPGDQFLGAALDRDHELLEFALRQKVVLATPTSFVALLRAIAFGWRQEQLADNAEIIRQIGEELYSRLCTFGEHLNRLGRSLETGVKHYNSAVGSFDSRVLPGARKFTELGIESGKGMEEIEQVDRMPKLVESEQTDQ